jgi:sorting nexin-27
MVCLIVFYYFCFRIKKAVNDVERKQILIPDNLLEDLQLLEEANRQLDYLKVVHKYDGYGTTLFPHCPCDSRKHGHVIVELNPNSFNLKACTREGTPESQVVEFLYEDIEKVDVDDEEMTFILEVKIPMKSNRKIKIFTGFVIN